MTLDTALLKKRCKRNKLILLALVENIAVTAGSTFSLRTHHCIADICLTVPGTGMLWGLDRGNRDMFSA